VLLILAPFWPVDGASGGLEPKSLPQTVGCIICCFPFSGPSQSGSLIQGMDWGLLLKEVGGGFWINFEGLLKAGRRQGFGALSE